MFKNFNFKIDYCRNNICHFDTIPFQWTMDSVIKHGLTKDFIDKLLEVDTYLSKTSFKWLDKKIRTEHNFKTDKDGYTSVLIDYPFGIATLCIMHKDYPDFKDGQPSEDDSVDSLLKYKRLTYLDYESKKYLFENMDMQKKTSIFSEEKVNPPLENLFGKNIIFNFNKNINATINTHTTTSCCNHFNIAHEELFKYDKFLMSLDYFMIKKIKELNMTQEENTSVIAVKLNQLGLKRVYSHTKRADLMEGTYFNKQTVTTTSGLDFKSMSI